VEEDAAALERGEAGHSTPCQRKSGTLSGALQVCPWSRERMMKFEKNGSWGGWRMTGRRGAWLKNRSQVSSGSAMAWGWAQ
jgi:hypothetical protein